MAALQICSQFMDSLSSFMWTRRRGARGHVLPFMLLVAITVIVLGTMIVSVGALAGCMLVYAIPLPCAVG